MNWVSVNLLKFQMFWYKYFHLWNILKNDYWLIFQTLPERQFNYKLCNIFCVPSSIKVSKTFLRRLFPCMIFQTFPNRQGHFVSCSDSFPLLVQQELRFQLVVASSSRLYGKLPQHGCFQRFIYLQYSSDTSRRNFHKDSLHETLHCFYFSQGIFNLF